MSMMHIHTFCYAISSDDLGSGELKPFKYKCILIYKRSKYWAQGNKLMNSNLGPKVTFNKLQSVIKCLLTSISKTNLKQYSVT